MRIAVKIKFAVNKKTFASFHLKKSNPKQREQKAKWIDQKQPFMKQIGCSYVKSELINDVCFHPHEEDGVH